MNTLFSIVKSVIHLYQALIILSSASAHQLISYTGCESMGFIPRKIPALELTVDLPFCRKQRHLLPHHVLVQTCRP